MKKTLSSNIKKLVFFFFLALQLQPTFAKKKETITYQNYLSPFFRASSCFDDFDKKGLKTKKIKARVKKGILGTYGGLSLAGGTLVGGAWVLGGITSGSMAASTVAGGGAFLFALGAAVPAFYLAPIPIAMAIAYHVANRLDNSGFVLEAVACANGDDCSGKKLKQAYKSISYKIPRRNIQDFSMTIARGILSGDLCKLSKRLPQIGKMTKWSLPKLKDNAIDPQKLSNQEKIDLYKGFLVMKFPKMDLTRPKSVIGALEARRVKKFQEKVRIEISAIQRILRDIEKLKSYHQFVAKKDHKDMKGFETMRSDMKKYLYELIKALSKK
jgi:hypothetical protein